MMDEYFDLTGHWNFVSSFTGSSKFINRAWAGLKFSQASSCKAAALGVSCHRNIQCLIASMASNRWHKTIGLWVIFESYSCPFSSSVEPCKRWRAFWRSGLGRVLSFFQAMVFEPGWVSDPALVLENRLGGNALVTINSHRHIAEKRTFNQCIF